VSSRKSRRALSRAVFFTPGLAVAAGVFSAHSASGQATGILTGSIIADYSSSSGQNGTVYGFSDASASLNLAVPIIPASAAVSVGAEDWSSPATWTGAPILLSNGGVTIAGNDAQAVGAFLSVPASANTLVNSGPTELSVIFYNLNLESAQVPGVNASFTVAAAVTYDVTIPTSADVTMDQQGVTVHSLTVDSGGTLSGDGNFDIRTNVLNQGIFDSLGGIVEGDFTNQASGDVTGALYVDGNFSNTGSLSLEQGSSLNLSLASSNNGQLDLHGGSISVPGYLTNNGTFNWYTGTIPSATNSLSGVISIFSGGSPYVAANATLTNTGLIEQGASTFAIDGDFNSNTDTADPAFLYNLAGGIYEFADDGQLLNQTSGFGYSPNSTFDNYGKLEKTGGTGTALVGAGIVFNNSGTVEVDSGTLQFDGGGSSNAGSYVFTNGGQIVIDSLFSFTGTSTGSGNGNMLVTNGGVLGGSGTINFPANMLVLQDNAVIGNGLTNAGSVTVAPTTYDVYVTGTFANTGTIQHTQGTFQVNPDSTLNNSGTIMQIGSNTTLSIDGSSNTFTNAADPAVVNNLAGGLYNIDGDGQMSNPTSGYPLVPDATFNNFGKFEKTAGTNTSMVDSTIIFNNSGTVEVDSGTLQFSGGGAMNGGTYVFTNGGQLVLVNTFNVTGLNTGTGNGALSLTYGALFGGGTINFGGASGVVLEDYANVGNGLTNAGNLQVSAPTYGAYVTGTFTNTATIQHLQGMFQIEPGSTLNNYGTMLQVGSNTTMAIEGNDNSYTGVNSPSVLNNYAGALYDLQSDGQVTNSTSGYPLNPDAAFNNYGTFEKTGGTGDSVVGPGIAFTNSGAINVTSGTLEFDVTVTNSSSITTGPAGRATFDGPLTGSLPISNSGALYFDGGSSTVGTISGNGALGIGYSFYGNPTTLQLAHNSGTSNISSLAINTASTLDIANNTLAINYGSAANDPVATIAGYLSEGYTGGSWSGAGIVSSTAAAGAAGVTLSVGYGDGDTDGSATTAGPNQVLVKYTLAGDANLDGIVNFTDFATVLKYFNQAGTDWAHGNFAYAANSPSIASTNFTDFADVLKNFLQVAPAASSGEALGGTTIPLAEAASVQPTVAPLPEPGGLLVAAGGAAGLLFRRKRRTEGSGCRAAFS